MANNNDVAAAVAGLFDAVTADEARDLEGIARALERIRGRRIEIVDADDLPAGVCGRWEHGVTHDVVTIRRGLPSRTWTLAHELGHVTLRHPGRAVSDAMLMSVASGSLVQYMLNRSASDDPEADWQEEEAERFAGLLMARIRHSSRAAAPSVMARLTDTFG